MIKILIVSLSLCSLALCSTRGVQSCSSNTGEVVITPCEGDPCAFKRGSKGDFKIEFTAPADSEKLTGSLTINVGGIEIPHPNYDRDMCNGYGIECPVKKGTKYTYTSIMSVLKEYPKIKTTFKFTAKDDSGNLDFCFTMPAQVVD